MGLTGFEPALNELKVHCFTIKLQTLMFRWFLSFFESTLRFYRLSQEIEAETSKALLCLKDST